MGIDLGDDLAQFCFGKQMAKGFQDEKVFCCSIKNKTNSKSAKMKKLIAFFLKIFKEFNSKTKDKLDKEYEKLKNDVYMFM